MWTCRRFTLTLTLSLRRLLRNPPTYRGVGDSIAYSQLAILPHPNPLPLGEGVLQRSPEGEGVLQRSPLGEGEEWVPPRIGVRAETPIGNNPLNSQSPGESRETAYSPARVIRMDSSTESTSAKTSLFQYRTTLNPRAFSHAARVESACRCSWW